MSPHDWNAPSYERVATGVVALGHEVLDRLTLTGDETVLDAGCGGGGVTEQLVARLPHGHVIAVDSSPTMVELCAAQVGNERAEFRVADLTALELGAPVDAILSTATFHWIRDHDALFARLHGLLRPGGRLVAQCGGDGNVAEVRAAAAAVGEQEPFAADLVGFDPWHFASAENTERRLREAGFRDIRCWLEPRDVVTHEPAEYLRTVMLGAHLERLAPEHHDAFVEAVHARLGAFEVAHYVRLNMDAVAEFPSAHSTVRLC
ncbi:MAG: methyltransferase domain-containing protein [Solirubrobacteraceae bacterium]|nr:methyltransferase domain-containing protein [Solirubrobacteraceae bacterium]